VEAGKRRLARLAEEGKGLALEVPATVATSALAQ
jgi:hypothetical protein